ncbi:hypothetical protein QF046_002172 [Microbacterium sp. W4I4]|uniref:rhodanese-like domain-containing protein n=1 Tax=Microbacterium sp. W4I4 TaxID=3042295 RepID=UPI002781B1D8|nr:rhodanese-like domain-containing protein [Microbacterium sp. W4I4]MDQ0614531.1 hypothetical protein [Microbacterium sp. W4I4]
MTDAAVLASRLAHVEARLAFEIDVVAAERAVASGAAVLVDTRRQESWEHGHIAGALHLPTTEIEARIDDLPRDRTLIVYGWGPDATEPPPRPGPCSPRGSTCASCSAATSTGCATASPPSRTA